RRRALMPSSLARSKSGSAFAHQSHATPERSPDLIRPAFSQSDHWLFWLSPSTWYEAVETPHKNPSGNWRTLESIGLNADEAPGQVLVLIVTGFSGRKLRRWSGSSTSVTTRRVPQPAHLHTRLLTLLTVSSDLSPACQPDSRESSRGIR